MKPIVILKRVIFVLALIPAAQLVVGVFTDSLTANPIDYIQDQTGTWALALLMTTLAITPVRRLTGRHQLIRLRRMLGLLAFFYATLHFLNWLVLDWFFDFESMVTDIVMRPFITMGMITYLLLLPLAITSTTAMQRRLGRRWQQLHRLIYVAAVTAVIHFLWVVSAKADVGEPRNWAIVLALLLGIRGWWILRKWMLSRS